METDDALGLAFPNFEIFNESGTILASGVDIRRRFREIPHREIGRDRWIFRESLARYIVNYGSFMHTSGLMVRRAVLRESGLFRAGFFYGEDDDFLIRCSLRSGAAYVDRVLCRARRHRRSLTQDPARKLDNMRSRLDLTEVLLAENATRREVAPALRALLSTLALNYAWDLIAAGRNAEAERVLLKHLRAAPADLRKWKLLVKSLMTRRARPQPS
jgi:hypothetical protein